MAVSDSGDFNEPHKKSKYDKYWRTPKLAEPKHKRNKFDYPEYHYKSTVRPTALTVECPMRNANLAQPIIRRLQHNKKEFTFLGPFFGKTMDRKISESWNTIYHYYERLQKDLKHKKSISGKSSKSTKSGKSTKSKLSDKEKWAIFDKFAETNAKPKKIFDPDPVNRGPRAELEEILPHMTEIALPKPIPIGYLSPRDLPLPVAKPALKYMVTENMLVLARAKVDPSLPPKTLAVSSGAKAYIATPRILELAVPKKAREKRDLDVRENPFVVSPAALKYKATERILELAKPLERD